MPGSSKKGKTQSSGPIRSNDAEELTNSIITHGCSKQIGE